MVRRSSRKNSKFAKVSGIVLTVVTSALIILMVIGVFVQQKQLEELKKRCTASVSGVCYDVTSQVKTRTVHKKRRNGSKSYKTQDYYTEYVSHIKYTVGNKDYDTSVSAEHSPPVKEEGSITVFYDPNDPSVCYIP